MDQNLLTSSTIMLILQLLENKDLYGFEMVEELSKKSDNVFTLKVGTLYPLLHQMEKSQYIISYTTKSSESSRRRKYYTITSKGKSLLNEKRIEWKRYSFAVNKVLGDL